jgi:cellulose synthase/poly-beta-1,6-N-acetylglucosamine synthase-like glycosyltransferase
MTLVAETFFWISIVALFYTYIGYFMIVYAVSLLFPKSTAIAYDFEPTVTVLITAYNEERDIKEKIENTLSLDYPKDKLQVIVASDGSTDLTDEIVKRYEEKGVILFRQEGRVGKTETQNNAVKRAGGEIVLFSDATTVYQANALRLLLRHFADRTVGCVAGKLVYLDDRDSGVGKGAKSYWNYETLIKQSESKACSLIGASGCMYAVRRAAYESMYPEACSDFLICTVVRRKGLRSIYEAEAICFENTNHRSEKEFQMRVRVISQTFTDLWRNRDMMNPLNSGFYAVQLISHKVLRYAVPAFLLLVFLSTIVLSTSSTVFQVILVAQVLFYMAAALGWVLLTYGPKTNLGPLVIPFYFVLGNLAAAAGFLKFLSGERFAQWEPIRDS